MKKASNPMPEGIVRPPPPPAPPKPGTVVDMFGHPVYIGERQENDYYPTPITCTDPLLKYIDWNKVRSFREPCRGAARSIYDRVPLPEECKDWAELSEGVDYLNAVMSPVDLIITNPPFSIALDFVQKSLMEAETVCYLLRLGFLGTKGRKQFLRENTPTHQMVIDRPSFTGNGTDNSEYAWFCWDRAGLLTVPPGMYWL